MSEERKIAELKIAAFITEHCSVNTADHLGLLLRNLDENSPVLSSIKLHRTKCAGLIRNVLSPCFLKDLITDVGSSHFSLIVDESTAIDASKMLCIMIRYFSGQDKKIKTTFYRLIQIEAGDANTISDSFKSQLLKDGLKLEKLIGIGVDGANVMVGPHHSLATILKTSVNDLVVVKCVCHSLHLAAEYACKTLPKSLDFLVKECHNWFSCSSKRLIEYRKLYETLTNECPLKLNKLSGTRWLARYEAIVKILEQWDALKLHFYLAKEKERCYTADQLYNMLNADINQLYCIFLRYMLKPITDLNKGFQSDSADVLKLMNDLHLLLYFYFQKLIPPSTLETVKRADLSSFQFKDFVMGSDCINFGYCFNEKASKLNDQEVNHVKEKCRDFAIALCEQLQHRIPDNIALLEKLSAFSPSVATSQIKPEITEIVLQFKNVCEDIDATLNEWNTLHRIEWSQLSSTEQFWAEVSSYENALGEKQFYNISKLALSMLSLPISNATVERAFSIVNIIKDKLRNKMSINTADAILRIRFNLGSNCQNFIPTEDMIKKFTSEIVYVTDLSNDDELILDAISQL